MRDGVCTTDMTKMNNNEKEKCHEKSIQSASIASINRTITPFL